MEKAFKGFTAGHYPTLLFGHMPPVGLPRSYFGHNQLLNLLYDGYNYGPRGLRVSLYDTETSGLSGERLLFTYGKQHMPYEDLAHYGIEIAVQSTRSIEDRVQEALHASWGRSAVERLETLYLTPKPVERAWYQKPSIEAFRLTEEQMQASYVQPDIMLFDSFCYETLESAMRYGSKYDQNYREGAVQNAWREAILAEKVTRNKPRSKYIR